MRRLIIPALFVLLMALAATVPPTTTSVSAAPATAPTFNKDILPILQKNCQECHRPGAIAPMSFVNFNETRPYARAIAKAVVNRTMPPWFADPTVGHFENARYLSASDITAFTEWAEKGSLEGDAKDRPAPVVFNDGWTIGKPDIIVSMPKDIEIPATGVLDQSNVLVYAHFEKVSVKKGQRVKAGQLIGWEGATGRASGCHLHYGLFSPLEKTKMGLHPDTAKRMKLPRWEVARVNPLLVLPYREGISPAR